MAREVLSAYRVGPHGAYGYRRVDAEHGHCPGGWPCWHWGLDMYPANLAEPVRAPEACRIVAITRDGRTPPLTGYGPGGLLVESAGLTPGLWRRWHVLAHLDPAKLGGLAVGQEFEEGEPIAPVYRPWAHCHWEIRTARHVPAGEARGAVTVDPRWWVRSRSMVEALAAAAGLVVAARALA